MHDKEGGADWANNDTGINIISSRRICFGKKKTYYWGKICATKGNTKAHTHTMQIQTKKPTVHPTSFSMSSKTIKNDQHAVT